MNRTLSFTFLAALILGACSSLSREPGDNDAMMAKLTPSQRSTIEESRATLSQRTDELAVARQGVVRAKAEESLAETDLDVAKVRVKRAETVVAIAETNSTEELESAQKALEEAKGKVLHQEQLLRWREFNVTRAERAEDLAECSQELAAAKMELEKARAFSQSDQAASRNIDVRSYETKVNEHVTRESVARAELAGAVRQCELAERGYNDAVEASAKKN
jgi:hypothetical protein